MTSTRRPEPVPRATTLICSCVVSELRMSRRMSSSARSGATSRSAALARAARMTSRSRSQSRVARPVLRLTRATSPLRRLRSATRASSSSSMPLMRRRRSARDTSSLIGIAASGWVRACRSLGLPRAPQVLYHGAHMSNPIVESPAVHTEVLSDPLPPQPLKIAAAWLAQAWKDRNQPNPNAMVLATATRDGMPSARVVLCKEIVAPPGYVQFYTNYQSRKGRELAENPRAALVMHWDHLHRQVRVEGQVVKAPESDSDAYFSSRALGSRLGAWASHQSEPVASRRLLLDAVTEVSRRFGIRDASDTSAS